MEISIIHDKFGYRAMFYYNGQIYSFDGKTAREARKKAQSQIDYLKYGGLL